MLVVDARKLGGDVPSATEAMDSRIGAPEPAVLEAGRQLQRLWLDVHTAGGVVSPHSEIIDSPHAHGRLRRRLRLRRSEVALAVFTVGRALDEVPVSPRLTDTQRPDAEDRSSGKSSRDESRRRGGSVPARTTRIALRTRLLGWVMAHSRSMHVSTMTAKDIAHNQTLSYLPRYAKSWVFGARHPEVDTRDVSIEGPGGALRLRVYRPRHATGALPAAVYFHGGGWTLFGGLDACDWLPSRVAALTPAVVVAVDYRLAPQHPYPAAVEDALAAVRWVAAHPDDVGADARLAVFGDSAGGNLSAVVALALRDVAPGEPRTPRLLAQGLIYPVTSTTLDDASMIENARKPVLFRADMVAFLRHYLGGDAGIADRSDDPLAAPLAASTLVGLPPALVQIADHDVLRDQGIAYAERLRDDGVRTLIERFPSSPHGWVTYPRLTAASKPASESLARFLRRQLYDLHE